MIGRVRWSGSDLPHMVDSGECGNTGRETIVIESRIHRNSSGIASTSYLKGTPLRCLTTPSRQLNFGNRACFGWNGAL